MSAHSNMALKKRKVDAGREDVRPSKRSKPLVGIASSTLREEEPFPRGGASVLTPLEHKQIKIQAKQDVLFEQTTGKKAPRSEYEDAEAEELSGEEPQQAVESKSKKGKTSQRQKKNGSTLAQERNLRIESLSYKVYPLVPRAIGSLADLSTAFSSRFARSGTGPRD